MHSVSRYHDISCGHRVHNHESKCQHLHGHNYRIHFVCEADRQLKSQSREIGPNGFVDTGLDELGRVIDFGEIKSRLCAWVEYNWDHKFLAWEHDPIMKSLTIDRHAHSSGAFYSTYLAVFSESVVWVPFNPTAENMAEYLVEKVGPLQLEGTGIILRECTIEETRKCQATYRK